MRSMTSAIFLALAAAAGPAMAAQLTYHATVGTGGGFAVLHGDNSGSVVVPGVGGGFAVFNSDKSVTAVEPNLGGGVAGFGGGTAASGYAWMGGSGIRIGGTDSGGVSVGSFGFRTQPSPGATFCLPPCLTTADGVAPDGSVVAPVP